jgi:hypothetical protein
MKNKENTPQEQQVKKYLAYIGERWGNKNVWRKNQKPWKSNSHGRKTI